MTRVGKKGEAKFRIVVATTRSKNKGKAIEVLGFVDRGNKVQSIDGERLEYWKSHGAKVGRGVAKILTQ